MTERKIFLTKTFAESACKEGIEILSSGSGIKAGAAQSVNLPAGLKRAGRTWQQQSRVSVQLGEKPGRKRR